MDPLALVLLVAALTCAGCWIASIITKDTSWVDRIWSIVPAVYVWIFAIAGVAAGDDAARLILMAVLVTAWAARLTFNFARKGGYTGMEDYRWAILRGRMKPWQFQFFNLFFIVLYQNALLVLITLPAFIAWQNPAPLNGWDAAFAVLFAAFLVGESVADQQQWDFHRRKAAAGGHLEPGFVTTGPVPRQPPPELLLRAGAVVGLLRDRRNCGGGIRAGPVGRGLNWTILGAVLLSVLFVGLDDLHRVDHGVEVPGLRRLPAHARRCSCRCPGGAQLARPSRPDGSTSSSPRHARRHDPSADDGYSVAYPSGFFDCQFQ